VDLKDHKAAADQSYDMGITQWVRNSLHTENATICLWL
jgi:hypothetical protein